VPIKQQHQPLDIGTFVSHFSEREVGPHQRDSPCQKTRWQPRHAYPTQDFDPSSRLLVAPCCTQSCTTFLCSHHDTCRGSRSAQCSTGQAASAVAPAAANPMASSQARFGTNTWLTHETCVHGWIQPRTQQTSEAQELTPQSQRSSAADKGCSSCSDRDASSKACRGGRRLLAVQTA
jgi:hypothetical protein